MFHVLCVGLHAMFTFELYVFAYFAQLFVHFVYHVLHWLIKVYTRTDT